MPWAHLTCRFQLHLPHAPALLPSSPSWLPACLVSLAPQSSPWLQRFSLCSAAYSGGSGLRFGPCLPTCPHSPLLSPRSDFSDTPFTSSQQLYLSVQLLTCSSQHANTRGTAFAWGTAWEMCSTGAAIECAVSASCHSSTRTVGWPWLRLCLHTACHRTDRILITTQRNGRVEA